MKKYIVFSFNTYYPSGGLQDISGSFDSMEEAVNSFDHDGYESFEIVDKDTWKVVFNRND